MNLITFIGILWFAAVLIQLYYWFWPAFKKPNVKKPSTESPAVSVVVCVNRDVTHLDRLLQCLLVQRYGQFEIVIVNDGPDKEIAGFLLHHPHRFRFKLIEFDASRKATPGKKAPLAAGIEAASHDLILLTDADCVPGPEWIGEMLNCMDDKTEMVLGVAPLFERAGLMNMLQRMDNFITAIQYIGAALRGKPYMGVGRNLLYRRALFTRTDGFAGHTHIASGDDDLFVQAAANGKNTTVCMGKKAFVYSEAASTWMAWLHQKRRHLSASKGYHVNAKFQTSVFAISWLVLWVGLPFIMSTGFSWYTIGLCVVLLLWLFFLLAARRFAQESLIPWYPLLAAGYCVMLCTFAIFMTLRAPKTWMRS